ncbi:non-functional NADPH-dependent codeinone reductase 2 [Dendrobium catenatum]|uniref:Non-functional NADPH-dependent codeinone reductase 2 n=1 Tax=Dendrobium catenatum TaxID=906689 RepID=A0A2I0WYT0_9ASPA|nr:non-functional NADPH-dependent codeinone reductase 2 [Dendrobium catenatum]PKU80821.1 Non-functional NADPH-dependent codeinone reductase 2 [Dendrobium catenatum]
MAKDIPEMTLSSDEKGMPAVGLGTVSYPPVSREAMQSAFFEAIDAGYRHFDTASMYQTESPLGNAIAEALRQGLVGRRDELFITTKLWGTDNYAGSVIPSLRESLRELQLDYVDLYLVHWPVSIKPSKVKYPFLAEDVLPMDMKSVWEEMEECQKLGLAKSIGVSNFSCKKLDQILATAKIPPAVNQVEMHPLWQQKKLTNFCKEKGIVVSAYSPLGANGAPWGTIKVMECRELKEIAAARGKSIAQISLRWIYEQGASIIVKTFNKERMKENLDIFDWKLSEEDLYKIEQLPQYKGCRGTEFLNHNGGFKSLEELWDGEI